MASSAGTAPAATHFYPPACLVLLRQCTDGRAGCARLSQPGDSDLLVSPRAVRSHHHGDARTVPHQSCSSSAKPRRSAALFFSLFTRKNYDRREITGFIVFSADGCMKNILQCANVMFGLLLLFSISLFVSWVIHDTYTFSIHAAGRIPGKHFNFDPLTLCFPSSAFLSTFCPLLFFFPQLHFTSLSCFFSSYPDFRTRMSPPPLFKCQLYSRSLRSSTQTVCLLHFIFCLSDLIKTSLTWLPAANDKLICSQRVEYQTLEVASCITYISPIISRSPFVNWYFYVTPWTL